MSCYVKSESDNIQINTDIKHSLFFQKSIPPASVYATPTVPVQTLPPGARPPVQFYPYPFDPNAYRNLSQFGFAPSMYSIYHLVFLNKNKSLAHAFVSRYLKEFLFPSARIHIPWTAIISAWSLAARTPSSPSSFGP